MAPLWKWSIDWLCVCPLDGHSLSLPKGYCPDQLCVNLSCPSCWSSGEPSPCMDQARWPRLAPRPACCRTRTPSCKLDKMALNSLIQWLVCVFLLEFLFSHAGHPSYRWEFFFQWTKAIFKQAHTFIVREETERHSERAADVVLLTAQPTQADDPLCSAQQTETERELSHYCIVTSLYV